MTNFRHIDFVKTADSAYDVFADGTFIGTVKKAYKNWAIRFDLPGVLKDGREWTDAIYPTRKLATTWLDLMDQHRRQAN